MAYGIEMQSVGVISPGIKPGEQDGLMSLADMKAENQKLQRERKAQAEQADQERKAQAKQADQERLQMLMRRKEGMRISHDLKVSARRLEPKNKEAAAAALNMRSQVQQSLLRKTYTSTRLRIEARQAVVTAKQALEGSQPKSEKSIKTAKSAGYAALGLVLGGLTVVLTALWPPFILVAVATVLISVMCKFAASVFKEEKSEKTDQSSQAAKSTQARRPAPSPRVSLSSFFTQPMIPEEYHTNEYHNALLDGLAMPGIRGLRM